MEILLDVVFVSQKNNYVWTQVYLMEVENFAHFTRISNLFEMSNDTSTFIYFKYVINTSFIHVSFFLSYHKLYNRFAFSCLNFPTSMRRLLTFIIK